MSSASEFGKDFCLVSEVVVTGRKAGWGHDVWKKLAHDEDLMRMLLPDIQGRAEITIKPRLTTSIIMTLSAVKKPKRLKDRKNVHFYGVAGKLFGSDYKMPEAKERKLVRRDLNDPLGDFDIIYEQGGEDETVFVSVPLIDLAFGQLIDATNAGSDDLHTDGKGNIGYIRNPENPGQVLYVHVGWRGDGWNLYVRPAFADQWSAGYRVFKATAS